MKNTLIVPITLRLVKDEDADEDAGHEEVLTTTGPDDILILEYNMDEFGQAFDHCEPRRYRVIESGDGLTLERLS